MKSECVGTNMLELTTCGAVPPYNPILAGKLVALRAYWEMDRTAVSARPI